MKTILITGIGRGIGKALAEKFLAEGYFVIGTYFSKPLSYTHENLLSYKLDLSSAENIETCSKEILETKRKIDILINNAGVLEDEDETQVIVEKLRKTLEVNLIGTIDFTEHIIPLLNKGGHIINISSTASSLEMTGFAVASHHPGYYPAYKISKTALNMYTRTLAMRLHENSITVSSVHPGWVKTDMGGLEADITPEEAAKNIYNLAISEPETGQFWFNGEKLPW